MPPERVSRIVSRLSPRLRLGPGGGHTCKGQICKGRLLCKATVNLIQGMQSHFPQNLIYDDLNPDLAWVLTLSSEPITEDAVPS